MDLDLASVESEVNRLREMFEDYFTYEKSQSKSFLFELEMSSRALINMLLDSPGFVNYVSEQMYPGEKSTRRNVSAHLTNLVRKCEFRDIYLYVLDYQDFVDTPELPDGDIIIPDPKMSDEEKMRHEMDAIFRDETFIQYEIDILNERSKGVKTYTALDVFHRYNHKPLNWYHQALTMGYKIFLEKQQEPLIKGGREELNMMLIKIGFTAQQLPPDAAAVVDGKVHIHDLTFPEMRVVASFIRENYEILPAFRPLPSAPFAEGTKDEDKGKL